MPDTPTIRIVDVLGTTLLIVDSAHDLSTQAIRALGEGGAPKLIAIAAPVLIKALADFDFPDLPIEPRQSRPKPTKAEWRRQIKNGG